jgi:hypothetical protein
MKRRKNIRDAFKHNGGGASKAAELQTAVITSITTYPTSVEYPNDFWVFYTYSGSKKISFADGEVPA